MKRPIQIGDRVSAEYHEFDTHELRKIKGVLQGFHNGLAEVKVYGDIGAYLCVPSSLRRLIPKKDPRKRLWINYGSTRYSLSGAAGYAFDTKEMAERAAGQYANNVLEVVEVRKKKND